MEDTVTTSWRRRSDESRKHRDSASARRGQAPVHVTEAQQLETWEDEGGRPGLCIKPVRILIVDNDISSSGSLEAMLHASGYSEIRVAYSGHAALAIAAEFQPSVVLLELNLLDMSGFEVARLLRGQARGASDGGFRTLPSEAHRRRRAREPVSRHGGRKTHSRKDRAQRWASCDLRQRHSSFRLRKKARANHRRDPARLCTPPHRAAGS